MMDKASYCMMIEGLINQVYIAILNGYKPNNNNNLKIYKANVKKHKN